MQSGNGIDLAAIYLLLTEVAEKVAAHDRRFDQIDRRFDQIDRRFELVDRRFEAIDRKLGEMSADITGLREAVTNYHASVLGHGILISELDERVRRIERHLKLEPAGE
jgi:chromosome segregation ATPase